jgi:hypothetical protein
MVLDQAGRTAETGPGGTVTGGDGATSPDESAGGRLVDGSPFPEAWGALHSDLLMHPVDVSDWPVKIDSRRQLFVDDYLIAERQGLRHELHPPQKHAANPIWVGETSWEGGRRYGPVLAYVLRDEASGRFRLWYRSRIAYEAGGRRYSFPNMYAESADGIHWERPSLGLYEFDGSKDNNLILPAGDLRGLLHEPHDAAAPWKAVWEHNSLARCPEGIEREGYYLYTSPDGIAWERARHHNGLIVPFGPRRPTGGQALPLPRLGDTGHVRWDALLGRYVCDAKGTIPKVLEPHGTRQPPPIPNAPGGDPNHRFRLQLESDDLFHWSRPRVVAFPDDKDFERGVIGFYGLLGTTYESMWIGYLRAHRLDPWKRVDVQLVTSRDGRTWSRACDRETFLPLGPEGSWEPDYSEVNHAGPLLVNDELWFFYRGSILEGHRGTGPDIVKGMGLATLRRDGFASLVAGDEPGQVTTRPLTFGGKALYVNAAALAGGSVRAEVLTWDGQPVDGFTAAECRPFAGDSTAAPLRWDTGDVGDIDAAGPLRLRFTVRSAHLYAFWIA